MARPKTAAPLPASPLPHAPAGRPARAARKDSWQVYLLECADGTLYCGITTNMARRLAQHNGLAAGGARYTRGRRPVRLLALRLCADKGEALRLEQRIKASPRGQKYTILQEGA